MDHFDLGVAGEQPQQLGAGVARRADDGRSIRHGAYYTGDCIRWRSAIRRMAGRPVLTTARAGDAVNPTTSSTIPPTKSFTATIQRVTSRAVWDVSVVMLVGSFRS